MGLKTNWMVSPWDALTDDGLKARPLAPTSTWICAERTVVARAARVAEAIAKRIFGEFVFWCVGKQRYKQGRLIYDQRKILITWKGLYENCRRKKRISWNRMTMKRGMGGRGERNEPCSATAMKDKGNWLGGELNDGRG